MLFGTFYSSRCQCVLKLRVLRFFFLFFFLCHLFLTSIIVVSHEFIEEGNYDADIAYFMSPAGPLQALDACERLVLGPE